jgi:ABC-type multidrug transport system ATPase subunit
VDGLPLDVSSTSAKAAIGLVPQDLANYPDLTARENLDFFGRLYGLGGRDLAAGRTRFSMSWTWPIARRSGPSTSRAA